MTGQQVQSQANSAGGPPPRLTLSGVIRSEVLKARAYRKVPVLGGLAVVLMGLMGAFAASVAVEGDTPAQIAEATSTIPSAGSAPAAFILAFAAIGLITDEYNSRSIYVSLTVVPQRGMLVLAKYLTAAALCVTVAALGIAAALLAALPFIHTNLVLESLTGSSFWVNVAATLLFFVVVSWIGLAAGFVFRRSLGAGAVLAALLVAVPALGATASAFQWPLLPSVVALTPGPLMYSATSTAATSSDLGPYAALALLAMWAVAAMATALAAFRR